MEIEDRDFPLANWPVRTFYLIAYLNDEDFTSCLIVNPKGAVFLSCSLKKEIE